MNYDQRLARRAADLLATLRERKPLVHFITNNVTVSEVANITLVLGALPIMAPSSHESDEMVAHADALVLNIGTPDPEQLESMGKAGLAANKLGKPIVLDPVGLGTTALRTEGTRRLLSRLQLSVVRGNAGEIGRLAGLGGEVKGVESITAPDAAQATSQLAQQLGVVAAATGARDHVAGPGGALLVDNGHAMLSTVVGTGCMATGVIGCFAAVTDDMLLATAAALAAFGIAGELAAAESDAPGSFKVALFDRLYSLTPDILAERAKIARI